MVTIRILAILSTLWVAACTSGFPAIRPLALTGSGATPSRFTQTYDAGKTSMRHDRVGLALVLFQKAVAIEPNSIAALNAVGTAYDELHHPELAARYYAAALALDPTSADTLNNMGVSAMVAGRRDEARDLFERALALDGENARIHANIALFERTAKAAEPRVQSPMRSSAQPLVERIGRDLFRLVIAAPPLRSLPPES